MSQYDNQRLDQQNIIKGIINKAYLAIVKKQVRYLKRFGPEPSRRGRVKPTLDILNPVELEFSFS